MKRFFTLLIATVMATSMVALEKAIVPLKKKSEITKVALKSSILDIRKQVARPTLLTNINKKRFKEKTQQYTPYKSPFFN